MSDKEIKLTPSGLPAGKFTLARDQFLYALAGEPSADDSSGDVDAPSGWFALYCLDAREATETMTQHGDAAQWSGLTDPREITGNFVLTEDGFGFVGVESYDTPAEAREAYRALESEYVEWMENRIDDEEPDDGESRATSVMRDALDALETFFRDGAETLDYVDRARDILRGYIGS